MKFLFLFSIRMTQLLWTMYKNNLNTLFYYILDKMLDLFLYRKISNWN